MANIGLKDFYYNIIKDGVYEKDTPVQLVGAIESSAEISYAEGKLYTDDMLTDSVKEFSNGTLKLVTGYEDDVQFAELMGHKTVQGTTAGKEVIRNINDAPPFVSFGQIITIINKGVKTYKIEVLPKVQFAPSFAEKKTKGESIDFGTYTLEGTIYPVTEAIGLFYVGDYERHKTFDTYDAAKSALMTFLKNKTTSPTG